MSIVKLSESIAVDGHDTSNCPVPASTLCLVRQTNGVIRIHANNGGYLFSIARNAETGEVIGFKDGFGVHTDPKVIVTKDGLL